MHLALVKPLGPELPLRTHLTLVRVRVRVRVRVAAPTWGMLGLPLRTHLTLVVLGVGSGLG